MFVLATDPTKETFLVNVTVNFKGDNGKTKPMTYKARFRRVSQEEIDTIDEEIKNGELDDMGLLNRVMVGWEGVFDEQKQPVEFTPENMNALMAMFPTRPTTVNAFFDSIKVAKAKNY